MKNMKIPSFRTWRMPVMVALSITYFGFHMMNGERGVYAFVRESHKQELLQKELSHVSQKREAMELKVSGLRNDSLDLDLLDQQARHMLGLMGQGEKLVLLPTN
jgi:cell division protein FtsB